MTIFFDTHCHIDASEFGHDLDDVVEHAKSVGITGLLIPAVQAKHFNEIRSLAHRISTQLPHTVYTLGIHPMYLDQAHVDDLNHLSQAVCESLSDSRFIGVGEIGLDYFVPNLDRQRQEYFFKEQLLIAKQYDLPVVMHVRRSVDAIIRLLKEIKLPGGIAHAFNGSIQQAQQLIELNCLMGFGGAMTYNRSLQLRRLAKELPLSSIALETDSPDIPPAWFNERGKSRNEPSELHEIASCISELRTIDLRELIAQTSGNALRVFPRWDDLITKLPKA